MAAVLGLVGGRARRGGVRGLLSLAFASGLANGILKPLFPRRRPPARVWANVLRGVAIPRSSSFPSGHAASAAAFTTGVALESPAAAAVVAPLAAAVAYSRVHNGVHWPSDVLAGLALGGAVASGTRRWWAVRSEEPAELGSTVDAPALPGGEDLLVLVNPESGADSVDPSEEIATALPKADVRALDTEKRFRRATRRLGDRHAVRAPSGCAVVTGPSSPSPLPRRVTGCRWRCSPAARSITSPGTSASPTSRTR